MTVTFVFPWKLNPVPAVQDASVLLARIVNGEAVPANALLPIKADCATLQRTVARLVQPENAELPMLVTLLGIVMLVRLVQIINDSTPILTTALGIFMLVREVQLLNA